MGDINCGNLDDVNAVLSQITDGEVNEMSEVKVDSSQYEQTESHTIEAMSENSQVSSGKPRHSILDETIKK